MQCHLCGRQISYRYCFCKQCAEKHNLGKYSEWPDWAKEISRSVDREKKQEQVYQKQICDLTLEVECEEFYEEAPWVARNSYNAWVQQENELSSEEVLDKYNLTSDEYEIITTDNLKELAEELNINYNTIRSKKKRLIEALSK